MKKQGFTLIELLVVVAIIGLLASITLVALKGAIDRARIGKAMSFSGQIYRSLAADAVGIWNFNEGQGGVAKDSSGNGNDGAISGAAWVDSIPELGNALKFNGANDYVDFTTGESLFDIEGKQITIAVWVKISSLQTGYFLIIDKRHGFIDNTGWLIQGNYDGIVDFGYGDGVGWQTVNLPINIRDNAWHHIVGVYDGTTLKIYFDGIEKNSFNSTAPPIDNNRNLEIGSAWGGGTRVRYVNGTIDEVRIYNRALSSAEIKKHYAEGLEKYKVAKK